MVHWRGAPRPRRPPLSETLAILADIHGNLEALDAVLADMAVFKPDRILVLGDIVGYGPEPGACLTRVAERADRFILGNHERDALTSPSRHMSAPARAVIEWTARKLQGHPVWERVRERVWRDRPEGAPGLDWLASVRDGDLRLIHAAPDEPFERYVWPGNRATFLAANALVDRKLQWFLAGFEETHAFCGHTHVPAVLIGYEHHPIFRGAGRWNRDLTFMGPNAVFFVPLGESRVDGLAGRKALINPGSVGQPRDGLAAASYALYDGNSLLIRRVPYDVEATIEKIFEMDIPHAVRERLAERLEEGR
ncbi:MAG: metallophosphatase family protein [Alphaproteobacteria bacterium]|nr:metallophosphatase family protein [Alphaproteobacteria bacterium]